MACDVDRVPLCTRARSGVSSLSSLSKQMDQGSSNIWLPFEGGNVDMFSSQAPLKAALPSTSERPQDQTQTNGNCSANNALTSDSDPDSVHFVEFLLFHS